MVSVCLLCLVLDQPGDLGRPTFVFDLELNLVHEQEGHRVDPGALAGVQVCVFSREHRADLVAGDERIPRMGVEVGFHPARESQLFLIEARIRDLCGFVSALPPPLPFH